MSAREDFTSEIFKIEIKNLAKFGFGELKKFLKNKMNLNPVKIKAMPDKRVFGNHAFVCFRSEEERTEAMAKLDGYMWKGKAIKATFAKAVMDPIQHQRQTNSRPPPKARSVLEATAPLAALPYEEQLNQKEKDLLEVLKTYSRDAQKINGHLKHAIKKTMFANNGLPCKWLGIKPSPQVNGYRNKSEFAVGKNAAGEKVVGFRLGSYIDGSVEVGSVEELPHIPENMKLAARVFQNYIRQSPLNVFSPEVYTGEFRQLTVRVSMATNEVMIVIGLHTKDIEAQLPSLKTDIVEYFTQKEGIELNVSSIYVELMNKRDIGQRSNVVEHIHGAKYITDNIHGLKFRISPESFFQINTPGAGVLYQCAMDLGRPTAETTVLDICCGTGTIGLCFAKICKQVVGVEIIAEAIKDAEFNAAENGIENSKFFAGNCDDYINTLVHQHKCDDLLAIIDPPRAGLHIKSIMAIRNAKGLDRFVYISCSPKAAVKNWVDLARPCSKSYKGNPFLPTLAVGVDMFPQTHHKEMVLLFERVKDAEEAMMTEEPIVCCDSVLIAAGFEELMENRNTVESADKTDVINEVTAVVKEL